MSKERDLQRLLAVIDGKSVSRRELIKRGSAIGLGASGLSVALGAVGGPRTLQARALAASLQDDPSAGVRGGKLTVALIGEPQTLDQHQTTASITAEITGPIYETLTAYDDTYQPQPMLAKSLTPSDDQLTWTIELREGVPFHNGEIMTAADVKASMDRWGQLSGVGKKLYAVVDRVETPDDHTIVVNLNEPFGIFPIAMSQSGQSCSIYPKSVIDAGTLEPNEAAIGTGPYKLSERKADAYIRLERFEDYAALDGGPVGYGGTKYAYADMIEFIPVPDMSARVAGLQAGDYMIVQDAGISNDMFDVLSDSAGLTTEINPPSKWLVFFINWQSELMSNLAMRESVQAVLDMEPLMQAAVGSSDFYALDPGLMMKQTAWWTDIGAERYNMADPELAKQKLQEAGYDGATVRFMSTQEYDIMYASSLAATQQMEAIGLKVDHQVVDWATLLERRGKPEEWDIFVTYHGFVPDPSQVTYVGQMNSYPGWWNDPGSMELSDQLLSLSAFEDRMPVWEQIQANAYEQIPALKLGDASGISSRSSKVGGWSPQLESGYKYWNFWIDE